MVKDSSKYDLMNQKLSMISYTRSNNLNKFNYRKYFENMKKKKFPVSLALAQSIQSMLAKLHSQNMDMLWKGYINMKLRSLEECAKTGCRLSILRHKW